MIGKNIVFDLFYNVTNNSTNNDTKLDKQIFPLPKINDFEENTPFYVNLQIPSSFKSLIYTTFYNSSWQIEVDLPMYLKLNRSEEFVKAELQLVDSQYELS